MTDSGWVVGIAGRSGHWPGGRIAGILAGVMEPKTSISHPLRIDSVLVPSTAGRIGMALCPGKTQDAPGGETWRRDLELDLDAIAFDGAEAVLTLLPQAELEEELAVPLRALRSGIERRRMRWFHLPIPGDEPLNDELERRWGVVGPTVRSLLSRGGTLLVHCKAGLGRTGTIAARLLVEFGAAPEDAIRRVRIKRQGAIETREQEGHVRALTPLPEAFDTPEGGTARSVLGCLFGGAVGDALGWPVEFASLASIRAEYGENGIQELAQAARGSAAEITDDTQMTLFTAEGLIRAKTGEMARGAVTDVTALIHHAYLRWAFTQGHEYGDGTEPRQDGLDGWLVTHKELHARRAPGTTCLSALSSWPVSFGLSAARPCSGSKGCGGVMRVAPIGLAGFSAEETFRLGCEAAGLTHGHPTGQLAAGALALIVSRLVAGDDLEPAIEAARRALADCQDGDETVSAINRTVELAQRRNPTPETVEQLGAGWVAAEALAIGLYAALVHRDDLPAAVRLAVNHSGDSDSTGAICGQLLGARLGVNAIPVRWLDTIELAGVIQQTGRDLVRLFHEGSMPCDEGRTPDALFLHRYPGW